MAMFIENPRLESTVEQADVLSSEVVLLEFCLMPGEPRPQVEVRHTKSDERWVV